MQGQCTDLSERLLQQCRAGTSGSKVFTLALLGSTLSEDSVGQTPEAIEARRQLWTTDVVAGLLLRSHVEQLCADRPAAQRPLPGQLQAALTSDAVPGVAGMLRLQHNEASFTALYAHFLLWAREAVAGGGRSCLQKHEAAGCNSRGLEGRWALQALAAGAGNGLACAATPWVGAALRTPYCKQLVYENMLQASSSVTKLNGASDKDGGSIRPVTERLHALTACSRWPACVAC